MGVVPSASEVVHSYVTMIFLRKPYGTFVGSEYAICFWIDVPSLVQVIEFVE
jgi:hypothetical protein